MRTATEAIHCSMHATDSIPYLCGNYREVRNHNAADLSMNFCSVTLSVLCYGPYMKSAADW